MGPEIGSTQPEVAAFPPEWQWLSVESVQNLRDQQLQGLRDRGKPLPTPPENLDAMSAQEKEAYADAKLRNYQDCYDYVAGYISEDDNPEQVRSFAGLIYQHGIYHVANYAWSQQEDGPRKYQYAQQAHHLIGVHADKIVQSAEPVLPALAVLAPAPAAKETDATVSDLDEARLLFAGLRLELRRQLHDKGSKRQQLKADCEAAHNTYFSLQLDEADRQLVALQEAGGSDEAVKAEAVKLAVLELHKLATVEKGILESDTSRRGRLARFLAKSNRRFFASTFVAGAAGGAIIKFGIDKLAGAVTATGGIVGTFSGVGIGIGMAIGTTRAAVTSLAGIRASQITEHSKRSKQDVDAVYALHEQQSHDYDDAGQYADFILRSTRNIAHQRIYKDQRHNKERVAQAALVGMLGSFAGALVVDIVSTPDTPSSPTVDYTPGAPEFIPEAPETTEPQPVLPPEEVAPRDAPSAEFNPQVTVEGDHGYTHELKDLAAQQDIVLTDEESYELYLQMADELDGDFFTGEGESYLMDDGNYGIADAGSATWNAAAMEEFQRWMIENEKIKD